MVQVGSLMVHVRILEETHRFANKKATVYEDGSCVQATQSPCYVIKVPFEGHDFLLSSSDNYNYTQALRILIPRVGNESTAKPQIFQSQKQFLA